MAISYLFVGDDFTGSSDTLAAIAETGKKVRLFLDVPQPAEVAEGKFDAVGIATDLRSLGPDVIHERITALQYFIKEMSPRYIHYKVCSTFDSGPETGNIAAAIVAFEAIHKPHLVAVIGGQPSLRRYCAFGNLFAADLSGEVFRIDRHPVMSVHPSTPMSESDLRVHLQNQGLEGTQLIPWTVVEDPPELARQLSHCASQGKPVLIDALNQDHIQKIGRAMSTLETGGAPLLLVGASSVPEAVFGSAGPGSDINSPLTPHRSGPCFVIAGSRSKSTASQIEAARRFEKLPIRSADLSSTAGIANFAIRCAAQMREKGNLIAHLMPAEDYGAQGIELALRLAALTQAVFSQSTIGKLGIAGGDTSSIIIRRLGFDSLDLLHRMAPGVALCKGHSIRPELANMTLMLKGGQVGGIDIFDRFSESE